VKTEFPQKIYTLEDASLARSAIEKGYRHRLRVDGSPDFREKTKRALSLIKAAGYYDILRAYVKRIVEVDGFSQLREVDSEIWANEYTVGDTLEAAGFLVQKAWQMKMHLQGEQYYTNIGERDAVNKRLEFLEALARKSRDPSVKEGCKRKLKLWDDSKFL
jgi:hypothetical protein